MFDKKEYMKKYWAEHMDERRRSRKKWREAHPEKVKEYNHAQYLRRKALREQEKQNEGGTD